MLLTSSHQINFPDQSGLKLSRWISGTIGYELTCNDGGGLQYFFWQTKGVNEYVWEEPWLEVFNVTKSTTWDGHCVFKNLFVFHNIWFHVFSVTRLTGLHQLCQYVHNPSGWSKLWVIGWWMVDGAVQIADTLNVGAKIIWGGRKSRLFSNFGME